MAITVSTDNLTLKKERRVTHFSISTPPESDPTLIVIYGEFLIDGSGNVLSRKDNIATLTANKQRIIDMLPPDNPYGLPTFTGLYVGLRSLFDDQFKINFSGQFPG